MRLAQALLKEPSLLAAFLNWEKAPWSNERNILAAVDESWFLRHWRDILRTSSGLRVAAAMAADDRKPISLRGVNMLKKKHPWMTTAPPPAQDSPVNSLFTASPSADRPPPSTDKTVQRQLEQAKGRLKRLEQKNKQLEDQSRLLEQQLERADKIHRRQLKNETQKRVKHLQEAEELAQRRVADYRARLFAGVRGPQESPAGIGQLPLDHLTKKAEKLLMQQAEKNHIFGSWNKLYADRENLIRLKRKVEEALSDAVSPLAELEALLVELRENMDQLNHQLSPGSSSGALLSAEDLEDCILRANRDPAGTELLTDAEKVLNGVLGKQLFTSEQRHTLVEAVRKRREWLQFMRRESALAHIPPPPTAPQQQDHSPKQLFDLKSALKNAPSPPVVILDGYNVIKHPAFPLSDQSGSQQTARTYLEKKLAAFVDVCDSIRIVYDGKNHLSHVENTQGIDVVFARLRGEDQQADDEIVDWLSRTAFSAAVWLVTNDSGLRARAAEFCDAFVDVHDFLQILA